MDHSKLRVVMRDQQEAFFSKRQYVSRDIPLRPAIQAPEIVIISGVRRSGKSTLLRIIAEELLRTSPPENIFYFNFEDERVVSFTIDNFHDLFTLFLETKKDGPSFFLLDEVQVAPFWEKWVNRLYEQEGVKVFLTGSNASLLSSEIATTLTGRNMTISLFPFSFAEFLRLRGRPARFSTTSEQIALLKEFRLYQELGSFPQVIHSGNIEFLRSYFSDILYRDIIARYSLRDVKEIKELAVYLASQIGQPMSYQQLAALTGIKSVSTIKNYWDYFQQSFLFFKLHKFDYSIKKQIYNPAKNYCIDVPLAKLIGFSFSANQGRALENVVFIELLRRGREVYYHKGKKECDFVMKKGRKVEGAIQVCSELTTENRAREVDGLLDALQAYQLKKGIIMTEQQQERIQKGPFTIEVVPIGKWLLAPATAKAL